QGCSGTTRSGISSCWPAGPATPRWSSGWPCGPDASQRAVPRCRSPLEPLCHRLHLHEAAQVVGAPCFGVGARHIEAPERLDAHEGAGDLAVEVEVAYRELASGALEARAVATHHAACEAVEGAVGQRQCVVEVLGPHDAYHRSEDLLAGDGRAGRNVGEDRRL